MRPVTAVAWIAVGLAACGTEPPPGADSPPAFHTETPVEEIMRYVIDPAADAIWDAVVVEVTEAGIDTHQPDSPEDWEALKRHAVTLVEGTNLLLMERRIAAEGSRSEMPGVDLEPEQIEALLAEGRGAWDAFAGGLYESARAVLDAIDRADVDALLTAGDGLDLACENCHIRFWYPDLGSQSAPR